ncbi:MAG: retropepsin-like aspartic protease [Niabella sp.]
MKRVIIVLSFLICNLSVMAQQPTMIEEVALISRAFNTKADSVLRPILAKNFSVAAYMGKAATQCLKYIVGTYQIESLSCKKVSALNENLWVADINILGAKDTATKFYFNSEGQLLRADLFDRLYEMNRHKTAQKVATIPFDVQDGSIIITATINDSKRPLRLLFDTGSDGMMLSKALADSVGLDVLHRQQASVVGGNIKMEISRDNKIYMNGFVFDRQSIAVFGNTNPKHDGILGNTLAKRYIVDVDYTKKEIHLYNFGNFSVPNGEHIIPVDVSTGNIEMQAELSVTADKPVKANFIFDTGAGYELIVFRPLVKKHRLLVDGFKVETTANTVSMGVSSPVFTGKAARLKLLPSLTINDFNVTLMGASQANANWQPETDGSLGIKFISQYNFIINLMDKYIAFKSIESR